MFEAFRVGITIALTNTVSSALRAMAGDFAKTQQQADKLHATLKNIKVLGSMGLASGAVGLAGFALLDKTYEAAKRYEMAFGRLKALNLGDVVNAQADKFARATDVMGVSSTQLMGTVRDLTAVTGNAQLAMQLAPKFAEMSFANQVMFGEHGMQMDENQIRALEKIIEIKGGYKDAATFLQQANMMQKVISGTGGMVKPSDFLAFIKTAGVSGRLLDNEQFYYTMEPLIQEMSGNRVGTGTMSAYNNLAQGRATVRAAREMMKLGLLDKKDVDYDAIGQVKAIHPGALKGFDQYTSDPFHWMQQVLIPAMQAAGYTNQKAIINEMGSIFGNRTGSNLFSLMYMQQDKIQKNVGIDKNAMGTDDLYALAVHSPKGAEVAYAAAMDRFQTAAGRALLPVVIPALLGLANALNMIADAATHHPNVAKYLTLGFTAIAAFFAVGGILLTGAAAWMGFTLVVGGLAALVGGGGALTLLVLGLQMFFTGMYAIYTHWEDLAPLLAKVWHGIVDWLTDFIDDLLGIHKTIPDPLGAAGISIAPGSNLNGGLQGIGVTGVAGMADAGPSIGAPPSNKNFTIENNLHLDGRLIGQSTSQYQYDLLNVASISGSNFDPRSSFSLPVP